MSRRGGGSRNFRGGGNSSYSLSERSFQIQKPRKAVSDEIRTRFQLFRQEIDDKNDKWERLVKCSRDITIESKRVIFLLHRVTQGDDAIFKEAEETLNTLRKTKFLSIARELKNEDANYFMNTYRPGLQEYIEADSFLYYLRNSSLLDWKTVRKSLTFDENPAIPAAEDGSSTAEKEENCLKVEVTLVDYLCGVGDLTGELMRLGINYVSAGNFSKPAEICMFLNQLYRGFALLGHGVVSKDFNFKLRVAKQNLEKIEHACYVLKLRGSEVPEHLLAEVMTNLFAAPNNDVAFIQNDFHSAESI